MPNAPIRNDVVGSFSPGVAGAPGSDTSLLLSPSGTFSREIPTPPPNLSAAQSVVNYIPLPASPTDNQVLTYFSGNWSGQFLANFNIASNANIAPSKLAAGTNGQVLMVVNGVSSWSTATASGSAGGDLSGSYPNPIIISLPVSKLATGINGQTLQIVGGIPTWSTFTGSSAPTGPAGGDLSGTYPNPTITNLPVTKLAPGTSGQVLRMSGSTVTWGATTVVYFNVKDYGAVGNGTTDDTAAINATVLAAYNAGGGPVVFPPTPNGYVIRREVAGQQLGGIHLRPGVDLIGYNTKLILRDNCHFIRGAATTSSTAIITSDVAVGATTITAAGGTTGFTAGNQVHIQLGQSSYDAGEPEAWLFAKVVSVTATTITIDTPISYAMSIAATTNTAHRQITKLIDMLDGINITGFNLINDLASGTNCESGITLVYSQNIRITDITADNPGAGLVTLQYSDGITIENTHTRKADAQTAASKGNGFSFAESRNVDIINATVENFEQHVVAVEANCKAIRVENLTIVNNFPGRPTANRALFSTVHKSDLLIDGMVATGYESYVQDTGGTESGQVVIRNSAWNTRAVPILSNNSILEGALSYKDAQYNEIKMVTKTIRLLPSQNGTTIPMPKGYYRRVRFIVSDKTGVNSLYLGYTASIELMTNVGTVTNGVVNNGFELSGAVFPGNTSLGINSETGKQLAVYTGATVVANAYLWIEVEYWPSNDDLVLQNDESNLALMGTNRDCQLYVEAGALKYRGSSGTVTTIAVA